jgi:hypothetical protein
MPDFEFADRADFQKMVDAQIEETLTLEYKASAALTRDSKNVQELCKDVSAMANSAGGQIIYCIGEDKKTHKPTGVDEGVTDDKITREWVHQILGSNIHPRMDGLTVQRIPLSAGGFGFVITVLPTQTGPHQAPDKKYYKRYELEAVAMDDYQIKDIMRRSSTPDLHVGLDLGGKDILIADFTAGGNLSKTLFLGCTSPTSLLLRLTTPLSTSSLMSLLSILFRSTPSNRPRPSSDQVLKGDSRFTAEPFHRRLTYPYSRKPFTSRTSAR